LAWRELESGSWSLEFAFIIIFEGIGLVGLKGEFVKGDIAALYHVLKKAKGARLEFGISGIYNLGEQG
jgi:hypothetical protein